MFFSVSSTLKGESEPYLVIYDTEYRDKSLPEAEPETEQQAESAEVEETEAVEVEEDENKFKIGNRLLLFLTKDEEGDGYSLIDYERGAKELSDADLRIYEKRIEEIASILASQEKQAERTVEWLVKCAEEPATRWEGAYELDLSFELEHYKSQFEAEEKEARERGDVKIPQENSDEQILMSIERDFYNSSGDAKFIWLLTDSQKERLTNALLNTFKALSSEDKSETEGLSSGDSVLLDLVARWDEKRLVPWLLANLRNSFSRDDYDTASFMAILARLLKNERLESLADSFEEISNETDEEAADAENSESPEVKVENDLEQESAENKNDSKTNEESAQIKAKKMTYKQQREQILNEFIAECETSLTGANESAKVRQKL